MILDEIKVENWRNYRGEHTFRFNEGINLIVGPNGSGKTTLFEVLWRSFFDRHNTISWDMQEIRPIGTSLSPRSTIIFRHGGKRYKIEKQFLDHQYAKLYEWDNGAFLLLHEQDRADSAVSEMLSGTLTGRGSSEPRHRGLAEALWYLQKDRSLPDGGWNEGLQRGFGGIIDIAVESPEERRILDLINRDYTDNLTESKGDPKKNTELYRVIEDLDLKNKELLELQSKLQSADSFRERLEQLTSEEIEKNNALKEAESNKKKSDEEIKEAESFERKKIHDEAEYDKASQKVRELTEMIKQIKDRNREITDLRKKIADWNLQFSDRQMKSSTARSEKEMLEAKWQSELQPRLKAVESELEALETFEKVRSLNKERNTLENFLAKFTSKEKEMNAKKKSLEEFIAPSEKELQRFRKLSEDLIRVDSKLSANSVKVRFQLKKGFSVIPEREISVDKGEFIVTDSSIFTIKNVGKVRIRGGAESLKELNERKGELVKSRSDTLKKYSVKDEVSLTRLLAQRNSLEQEVKTIKREVSSLLRERPNAEDDLARVKRDIITTQRKTKDMQLPTLGSDEVTNQTEVLSGEKRKLIREIADAQFKEKEAFKRYEEENLKSGEIKSSIVSATARISTLEDENAKAITLFGSMQGLEDGLKEAIRIQEKIHMELIANENLFDEKVASPRRRAEIIGKTLEQINERLIQVGKEMAELKGVIEQIAADGLYTKVSDLEIEIGRLESRKIVLERRANARRLLRELINMFKTQRALAIGAPIRKYIDPWLRQLSGGTFDSFSINETLEPDSATLNDRVNKISFGSLSYGTAEQVVVLTRLAIATILSQKEKNLVVLDDRLVNADPIRLQRMLTIIDEVSENCQIVISTCEDARYLGVAANVIRLPTYKVES
ncbi:MAG: AAA family ATPase [Thermoplasmatales archaeon]